MVLRRILILVSALIFLPTATGFAQETKDQSRSESVLRERRPERQARRQRLREHRLAGRRDQLLINESQRQQLRQLRQTRLESTRSLRQELFELRDKRLAGTFTDADKTRVQQLRQELRESMKGMRSEMQNILTPEQRLKIEEQRKIRQERRERIRERRRAFRP